MMESSTGDSDQDAVLDVVLSALFYGIGERKPLTRNTLKLIEESKPALGEANSLLVEGVLQLGLFQGSGESVVKRYFIKAEEKGCNHSILYHYLGECYYKGKMGIARNVPIALEYYTRAIAGGNMIGYLDIFTVHRDKCRELRKDAKKALIYLIDLEREGCVDGSLFVMIGDYYRDGTGYDPIVSKALEYYHRAVDVGHDPAYLLLYDFWQDQDDNDTYDSDDDNYYDNKKIQDDKALLVLLEAERKGAKHDGILNQVISRLYEMEEDTLSEECLERQSPHGYFWKGHIYLYGMHGGNRDPYKAVSIWEEADKLGLASFMTYKQDWTGLIYVYMTGMGVTQNGVKALTYCEKALELATSIEQQCTIYRVMADMYEKGVPPLGKDNKKAKNLRKQVELLNG